MFFNPGQESFAVNVKNNFGYPLFSIIAKRSIYLDF